MDEVNRILRNIGEDAPRALVRSINKTLPGVRTDMTAVIYDQYNVTKTKIRSTFSIKKASLGQPSGIVATKGRHLNLIEFAARQTQKGVTVKILRQGARKLFIGAFIRIMKTGKELVLQRKYHATKVPLRPNIVYGRLPEKYRLPVQSLFGPRLQDCLEKPDVWARIERMATERLIKAANHEADYLIKRRLEGGDGFSDTGT